MSTHKCTNSGLRLMIKRKTCRGLLVIVDVNFSLITEYTSADNNLEVLNMRYEYLNHGLCQT